MYIKKSHMLAKNLHKLFLPALIIWLVPLFVSFFFFNQEGDLQINFWLFKAIMLVAGSATAFVVLSKHYKKHTYPWLSSSLILLLYNILLDLILLIGVLGTPLGVYFSTTATLYVVFIPLSNYLAKKSIVKK